MSQLSSKIDPESYKEDLSKTDFFPYTRPLFSDGWNSAAHFLLGYLTNDFLIIAPIFLGYQYMQYKPYDNTLTDVEEYALGFLAGGIIHPEHPFHNSEISNFFKLKMMGII